MGTPSVTIQLPIYNEKYVAKRLVDSVCELDYPKEKMKIMARNMEMVKKDLDSGELSMFGMRTDGRTGFLISNQDVKTIYTKTQILCPVLKFNVFR